MNPLRSHPHLLLEEHIAQVLTAADALVGRHSPALGAGRPNLMHVLRRAIRLHDLGKGSRAFQAYIKNPEKYRGSREAKRHTPLSTLAAVLLPAAEADRWPERLATVAAVAGHHHGFHPFDDLEALLASTTNLGVLSEQLDTFPWKNAQAAVGLPLDPLAADAEPWMDALDSLEEWEGCLKRLPVGEAIGYRLWVQLLLSLILEADKALLAVKAAHVPAYLGGTPRKLSPAMVERFLAEKPKTPLDALRSQARRIVLESMEKQGEDRLFTATLPTGTGKTLIGASWALRLRERLRGETWAPRIIIVLPYLSIVDQTQKEYCDLLADATEGARKPPDSSTLMASHSLAERVFDPEMDGGSSDFFLDTWHSQVVITTFDQFLFALLSPAARHQLRFHHLCDALIIMDEVQSLPCILWHPLSMALSQLARLGETRVLAMSATQPGFLDTARELVPDPAQVFAECRRYRIRLCLDKPVLLETFIEDVVGRLPRWHNRRVLITLNTRRSARAVRDALEQAGAAPLYFITADVTPKDRLESIRRIKEHQRKGEGCLVVSTQCIEAGVDIDMDLVLRDFAPLDSIIQIAGRCNRNGAPERAEVEVYDIRDARNHSFAGMIYDGILLQETRRVLGGRSEILEEEVFALAAAYFDALRRNRDTGEAITKALARWEETESVQRLLRGPRRPQVTFVVVEEDPGLRERLEAVAGIEERWERRRQHRALAGPIAQVSVSVYARDDLDPRDYADPDPLGIENRWLLRPGFYQPETGLDLARAADEPGWGWIT